MYFAVQYKSIKSGQDYADSFPTNNQDGSVVICDGIGEYPGSGEVSKLVVEKFGEGLKSQDVSIQDIINQARHMIEEKKLIGGTTFIAAKTEDSIIHLHYLGDGGIIHLHGNFAQSPFEHPYRYADLMIPHIMPEDGALTRHISHNSGEEELMVTSTTLTLNAPTGDILVLYSDGISALEEKAILKNNGLYWRNEQETIQIILKDLHIFLKQHKQNISNDLLNSFISESLEKLNQKKLLEDDASLGIIITEDVINYYK